MFVDRIKVFAQAGNGGRGCVSFRREKFVPKGGPDGGDGGRGGDVILRADQHTDQLSSLFYEPIIKAKNGEHGQGKKMHGRNAAKKVVKVPVGTMIWKDEGGRMKDEEGGSGVHSSPAAVLLADLTRDGEGFILCQGGAGGKGNVHFKSSRNRAPRQYTEGGEGESGYFLFELRTIADAALVGYPNAGKSTFLRRISAARPKVAPYPFTTLHPIIGVVDLRNYRRATVADIPGLIEGAHLNLGLGHDFLRHITRCGLFLFVLDMAGSEGRSPIADLQSLRREIDLYDSRLSARPWFVIANKMDLPGANENLGKFRAQFPQLTVIPISAKKGTGIGEVKQLLEEWVAPASERETTILPQKAINK
jgi:GTPase